MSDSLYPTVELRPQETYVEVIQESGQEPVIDIVVETDPVIDIIGVGMTGPKGNKGDKGEKGDKGDKGDTGDPGDTGAISLEFVFTTPAHDWIIDHELHTYAFEINVYDHTGREYMAEIEYATPDRVIVHWYYAMTGVARIIA